MSAKLWLRIASGCMAFFAIGHTAGHFTRHHIADPEARRILQLMAGYKMDLFGQRRSYEQQYTGMSLNLILTLAAFCTLLWMLSGIAAKHPGVMRRLLLPVILCTGGFAVTSYLYFFPMPAITCLLACICMVVAMRTLPRQKPVG